MKRLKLSDLENEKIEKYRTEFWLTNNNGVFKRRYHEYLGQIGELICDYCSPGSGCNSRLRKEWYRIHKTKPNLTKYPSWKLVSKNSKQWMKKPLKMIGRENRNALDYIDILW